MNSLIAAALSAAAVIAAAAGILDQFETASGGLDHLEQIRAVQPTQEEIFETFYPTKNNNP